MQIIKIVFKERIGIYFFRKAIYSASKEEFKKSMTYIERSIEYYVDYPLPYILGSFVHSRLNNFGESVRFANLGINIVDSRFKNKHDRMYLRSFAARCGLHMAAKLGQSAPSLEPYEFPNGLNLNKVDTLILRDFPMEFPQDYYEKISAEKD